jgi:hypothetical protein
MNKLKWAILLIYTSTLALLRMVKLAILSYFLKVAEKYDVHDIKPMEFQQKMYFPSTPSTVIFDILTQPETPISTFALFRRMFWRFDILPFSPGMKAA